MRVLKHLKRNISGVDSIVTIFYKQNAKSSRFWSSQLSFRQKRTAKTGNSCLPLHDSPSLLTKHVHEIIVLLLLHFNFSLHFLAKDFKDIRVLKDIRSDPHPIDSSNSTSNQEWPSLKEMLRRGRKSSSRGVLNATLWRREERTRLVLISMD